MGIILILLYLEFLLADVTDDILKEYGCKNKEVVGI
jgi:hypothetical protein